MQYYDLFFEYENTFLKKLLTVIQIGCKDMKMKWIISSYFEYSFTALSDRTFGLVNSTF